MRTCSWAGIDVQCLLPSCSSVFIEIEFFYSNLEFMDAGDLQNSLLWETRLSLPRLSLEVSGLWSPGTCVGSEDLFPSPLRFISSCICPIPGTNLRSGSRHIFIAGH